MIYQRPKGNVRFAYGRFDDLPYGAEEVKIFMVPGDPVLYVVPVGDIPYAYEKNETKHEDDWSKYLRQIDLS